MSPQLTDYELAEIVSHNSDISDAAFSELDNRLRPKLMRMVYSNNLRHIELQDIVQDTIWKLWLQCTTAEPPGSPLSWCKSVLNNQLIDISRRSDYHTSNIDFELECDRTPLEDLFLKDLLESVSGIVESMSEKTQSAWDAYHSGLDGPEAAKMIGISESAYRKRLHEAKSKIRLAIDPYR